MGTEYQRVSEVAAKLATTHTYGFPYVVRVCHEDGTHLVFNHAIALQYYDPEHSDWGASLHPGMWLMVFTEHQLHHVFSIDDLSYFDQLLSLPVEHHGIPPVPSHICDSCQATTVDNKTSRSDCNYCFATQSVRPMTGLEQAEVIKDEREFVEKQAKSTIKKVTDHFKKD
jgi:hypothetical protein